MATPKIILFYVVTPLADPTAVMLWQRTLAELAGVKGRVIISYQGINATLGGDIVNVKKYVKGLRQYPPFAKADIKWSDGYGDDFPRLSVKVRPELVTFGVPERITVTEKGVVGGGERIAPARLESFLQENPDAVLFDGRNQIEAAIGKFKNAVVPKVDTTREFTQQLEQGVFDDLKNRPVVTYCTGGIRCEFLTAIMKQEGFTQVYQLDGGIVRYGEQYGDEGLWEGSLYSFDSRMQVNFSDSPAVIASCRKCGVRTSRVINFPGSHSRNLIVMCEQCG